MSASSISANSVQGKRSTGHSLLTNFVEVEQKSNVTEFGGRGGGMYWVGGLYIPINILPNYTRGSWLPPNETLSV